MTLIVTTDQWVTILDISFLSCSVLNGKVKAKCCCCTHHPKYSLWVLSKHFERLFSVQLSFVRCSHGRSFYINWMTLSNWTQTTITTTDRLHETKATVSLKAKKVQIFGLNLQITVWQCTRFTSHDNKWNANYLIAGLWQFADMSNDACHHYQKTKSVNKYLTRTNRSAYFYRPSPRPRGSARRKTASSLILRGHF